MDEDIIGKIMFGLVVVAAVVFDWPRALAGSVVGFAGRHMRYHWIWIAIGAVLVTAAGELIYSIIGRTPGMAWGSFTTGLIASGAGALGVMRLVSYMMGDVEAPK